MLNESQENLSRIMNVPSFFKYHTISDNYVLFKESFKEQQNFYISYFYFLFGEHYESLINNVNFFHYATESLILEILKKIDKDNISIFQDEELISLLKDTDIDSNNYYDNIKLLTGSCYIYDQATKLSEMKIANVFLQKFKFYKEEYFSSKTLKTRPFENISFKSVLIKIVQKAASSALIEVNLIPIKDEYLNKELFLYHSFHKDSNPILINYIKTIQKNIGGDLIILKENNLVSIIKMYYFFCKTSFDDYLHDIDFFSNHSTTLFQKIKKISQSNMDKLQLNFNSMIKSKTFENLKYFYNFVSYGVNNSNEKVSSNLSSFKVWINESISTSPNFFYEKYKISKLFVYNKILKMGKNILVIYTDRYITFLITNLTNVKKTMDEVTTFFLSKADLFITNFGNKINEKELCIRFSSNEDINFIKVDVDRTVMILNPKKFKEYAENFCNHFTQSSCDFLEKSKNYLYSKYKLFLGDEKNFELNE